MKLGLCTNVNFDNWNDVKLAAECGFQYLELPVRDIVKLSKDEIESYKRKAAEFELPVLSANGYFPNDLKFVGSDIDPEKIESYAKKATEKLSKFGVKTAVFGSGPSRAVPDGFSKEAALSQIAEALGIVNREAVTAGIEIVIEPLSKSETNTLNTVRETYDFLKKAQLQNVHLLADLYHVGQERDLVRSLNDIYECRDELRHVHLSCPIARTVPTSYDGFDYALFFKALEKAEYRGNISVEAWPCSKENLTECKEIFQQYTK